MSIAMIEARPVREDRPFILQGRGRTYELDEAAFNAAMDAAMAASEQDRTIGTGEAARLLGVSRKTVQRILDAGRIPCRRNGELGNRMMRESDVIAYRDVMRSDRRQALGRMRDLAVRIGMYEEPAAQDAAVAALGR